MREKEFYATFYCASVTRCDPGRQASGRGDRTPTPREQELCAFWGDRELELIRAALIVPVGGLAIPRLLGRHPLAECVGRRFDHERRSCRSRSRTLPGPAAGRTRTGRSSRPRSRDPRGAGRYRVAPPPLPTAIIRRPSAVSGSPAPSEKCTSSKPASRSQSPSSAA